MAKSAKSKNFSAADAFADVESAVEKFRQVLVKEGIVEPVKAADVDDEEESDEELDAPDREEVEAMSIKELRALAKEYGIDATKKADILAEFEDLYEEDDEDEEEDEDDDEDEDDEDDEEEEDDEDEDDEELDRDDLEEMSLKDLRVLAKENGHKPSDYKGMDQDAIIDLIMGEEDEDEDENDEEDEDEDEEVLDEDALNEMTQKDLIALAKDLDLKVPAAVKKNSKANHKKLVNLILDSGEEE